MTNLLRDEPDSTGYPSEKKLLCSRIQTFCSTVFPKPIPGSRMILSSEMPASRAFAVCSLKNPCISCAKPSPITPSCMVACVPLMCIMTTYASAEAQASAIPSARRPLTSFMMSAPSERHSSATGVLRVSTDTGTSMDGTSSFKTGLSREISSSADTGADPGRVDSAPRSIMSAPCSTMSKACFRASPGSVHSPPSEKESGVTLRMPIIRGPLSGEPLGLKCFIGARPRSPRGP